MLKLFRALSADRRGATAIEYGLILALIAVAASGAIVLFADAAIAMWELIRSESASVL